MISFLFFFEKKEEKEKKIIMSFNPDTLSFVSFFLSL